MTSKRHHLVGIQDQIRKILLEEWDPIGIRNEPGAQDEYDSYVGPLHTLLLGGAPPSKVADHLAHIEDAEMGLPISAEKRLPVRSAPSGQAVEPN